VSGAFSAVTLPGARTSTIGLNPSVTMVYTTYDGGKVLTGNGSYTKYATFGWVLKMFGSTGTNSCASTAVNTPTGYVLWTGFVGATTAATCVT
jgi:hypothetical protein